MVLGTWFVYLLGRKSLVVINPDQSIARLKAHLGARGYAQTYGVDYSNNFSPVAKMTSVRLFISLVATYN